MGEEAGRGRERVKWCGRSGSTHEATSGGGAAVRGLRSEHEHRRPLSVTLSSVCVSALRAAAARQQKTLFQKKKINRRRRESRTQQQQPLAKQIANWLT